MPTLARPEVDVLEGLTTAIIVDQQRMGANSRSTVGTATDTKAMLRVLFAGAPADLAAPLTAPRRVGRLDKRVLFPACRFVGWSYRIPKLRRELINRGRVTNTRRGTYEDDDM